MASRAKQVRKRYQVRLNLHDGMGGLWEYLQSVPEGSRSSSLIYIAMLGAEVRLAALQSAAGATGIAATRPAAAEHAAVVEAQSVQRPQTLDPAGAAGATAAMVGWDSADSFDVAAPTH